MLSVRLNLSMTNSDVGLQQSGYGLHDRGIGVRFLAEIFSCPLRLLESVQPPPQWIKWVLSSGLKRPLHEADHSPSSTGVKNA